MEVATLERLIPYAQLLRGSAPNNGSAEMYSNPSAIAAHCNGARVLRNNPALWARLKDHVEWGLGCATDLGEAPLLNDFPQFGLTGLGTQRCTYFLRERGGHANHGRRRIIEAAHWV